MEVKNFEETRGKVPCLKQNTKFFNLERKKFIELCQSKTLKLVANAQLSVALGTAGRNFGALKNMGGLCFQVLGS